MNPFLFLALQAAAAVAAPEMVASVSSPQNDYNLSIADDHRTLVVARSEADFRNARILVATRRSAGEAWGEPQPIGFTDPRWSDSDPWLTPDGRTLYFISTRPAPGREEGRTDYDIWRSVRTADGWSAPEHLGANVNSRGQELGPELHDGALYFSSARRSGRGGLDVYRAAASGGGFAPAALLDGPVNTAASESDFTLSGDGRSALFWRSGENGTAAIHIIRRTETGWSNPAPLPPVINHGPFNFTPSFTRNGRSILYASTRPREGQEQGLADIYWAPLP
jgi:Tol biopolymer transport system component